MAPSYCDSSTSCILHTQRDREVSQHRVAAPVYCTPTLALAVRWYCTTRPPGDSHTDHMSETQSFDFRCEETGCPFIVEVLLENDNQHYAAIWLQCTHTHSFRPMLNDDST